MKTLLRLAAAALTAATLGACSSATTSQFRLFPPDAADKNVNNAAYYDNRPYGDDCWQYGWSCQPPGVNPNIHIGGPYANPARPVYVVEQRYIAPNHYVTRRIVLRNVGHRYHHRRPGRLVTKD